MSQQEAVASAGEVDTVNSTGITLTSVNCRGYIEGTAIYVREKSTYYILEFNQSNVIDHDLYETAKGISGAQWIKFVGGGASSLQLTGDVTAGPGLSPVATTITAKAVTLSKFQDVATASVLGRSTAGSGSLEVLSLSNGLAIISGVLTNTAPLLPVSTIFINNAVSTPITALELDTTLTNNGAGTEASQLLVKLFTGGAQTTALTITPVQTQFPAGTASVPGVAIGAANVGFYRDAGNSSIDWTIAGSVSGLLQGATVWVFSQLGRFIIGNSSDTSMSRTVNGMELATFNSGAVVLGLSTANNASFFSAAPGFSTGSGIIAIKNRATAPTGNFATGGYFYAEAGALLWRGSSGTITTIAPA